MTKKKLRSIITFILITNFILVIFSLLIEKLFDYLKNKENMNDIQELAVLSGVLLIALFAMFVVYRTLVKLLSFTSIADDLFTEHQRLRFYELIKKLKKGSLNEDDERELNEYIKMSHLPENLINMSKRYSFSFKEKCVILLGFLFFILHVSKKGKA